jgi:hypothetical protein
VYLVRPLHPPSFVQYRSGAVVIGVLAAVTAQAWFSGNASAATQPVVVADWVMDDASDGVMRDASTFGNDGALQNVALSTLYKGQDASYKFPATAGKTSRVVVPDDDSLNPDDQTFAVSLRVNFPAWPTAALGDFDLIRKGQASDGRDWKVEVMQDGHARCYAHGSKGTKSLLSAKPLSKGDWHTLVCTFTPSAVTIQVDALSPKKQSSNLGTVNNTARVSIGAKVGGLDDGGDQYSGRLADVVITKG